MIELTYPPVGDMLRKVVIMKKRFVLSNAVSTAVLSACLYALSTPLSKLLLQHISTAMMAACLYLGAGLGMSVTRLFLQIKENPMPSHRFCLSDFPWLAGMILLDIFAPLFLMNGLSHTSAANAALLENFEISATALFAFLFFKERISKKLCTAIVLITAASIVLSFDGHECFTFSYGSLLILLACACWGLENNFTRKLSSKNPITLVAIKGLFAGTGSLFIALWTKQSMPSLFMLLIAFAVGYFTYGLSLILYILSQRSLGAARTSAYYASAPFIGAFISLLFFHELPSLHFLLALALMFFGTFLVPSGEPASEISTATHMQRE